MTIMQQGCGLFGTTRIGHVDRANKSLSVRKGQHFICHEKTLTVNSHIFKKNTNMRSETQVQTGVSYSNSFLVEAIQTLPLYIIL